MTASADKTARIWDAATGYTLTVLRGHTAEAISASFSPNGNRIVTASGDMTAGLWNAITGDRIAVLRHNGKVHSASFSSDGRYVVTASEDQTARVWTIFPNTQSLIDYAEAIVPRQLTPHDHQRFFLDPADTDTNGYTSSLARWFEIWLL